jgi:hypothetical protein
MEICEVFMIPSRKVKAGDAAGIFSVGHPGSAGGRQKALALAMAQTGTQTGLQDGGQAHLPVRPLKDTPLKAMGSEIISRRDYRRRPQRLLKVFPD